MRPELIKGTRPAMGWPGGNPARGVILAPFSAAMLRSYRPEGGGTGRGLTGSRGKKSVNLQDANMLSQTPRDQASGSETRGRALR